MMDVPARSWVRVGRVDELPADKGKTVRIGRRELAIFHVGGKVYALSNVCPHAGGPLAEGYLVEGPTIECPWHYWGFRLWDGRCTHFEDAKVETFEVRVEAGEVSVLV